MRNLDKWRCEKTHDLSNYSGDEESQPCPRSEEERRTKDSIDFPDKCIANINGALCDGNAVLGGKVRERCLVNGCHMLNLEIVRKISGGRLVIDTGTRTRLILIPNASTERVIRRLGGGGSRTVRGWWDWILTHDDGRR